MAAGQADRRTTAPLVSLDRVGIERQGRWLIHDISLDVVPGEIVTLIGPNGGGKTTLVRALLSLSPIERGRIVRAADLVVGYVPQRLAIDPILPLTVARLMTMTRPSPRDAVRAALARTGVEALIDRPVRYLSGGEFQRVLLARALLRRPNLLVLDEPVQGVDYAGEAALYALISDLRGELGCAILMVSHDLHIVMAATDRVVCLNHHICCTGAPREVAHHAEYRRLFGPRAVDAFAVYEHHHDHDHGLAGDVVPDDAAGADGAAHSHEQRPPQHPPERT